MEIIECTYFELHVHIGGLLSLLHQTQAKGLEVDLMLGLFDDLSEQGSGGTEVVILISQQVLEHHGQELDTGWEKGRERAC